MDVPAAVVAYDPRWPGLFRQLCGRADAAGWRHQGDLGITGREAFVPPADAIYHHLYVVVAGSQPHRDHIDLRGFLRTHPAQAARYSGLKRRLAVLLKTDRSAYSDGKAEMISEFLRQARCSSQVPLH